MYEVGGGNNLSGLLVARTMSASREGNKCSCPSVVATACDLACSSLLLICSTSLLITMADPAAMEMLAAPETPRRRMLTREQRIKICALRRSGMTYSIIAAVMRVTVYSV